MTRRPTDQEYAPFYAGYVALVPEHDVLTVLRAQADDLRAFAQDVPADRESFAYGPGKWTVRQVMGHLGDAERVFGYRAFRISRGDRTPLASFDENLYVDRGRFDDVALTTLAGEFAHLRAANLAVLDRLDEAAWDEAGTASGHHVTVRALAWMMAGHVRHHLRILRDRYGLAT